MTIIALLIALYGSGNVFSLVMVSWSILAAAFTPLIFNTVSNRSLSEIGSVIIVLVSIAATILWRQIGLHNSIYEALPGMTVGIILSLILSKKESIAAR